MAKNQGNWLIGRLTKDARFQTIGANNTAKCSFTVAVDRDKRPDEDTPKTDFPQVTTWRKLAEKCKDLRKGSYVFVLGTIQTGSYNNKNGDKVYTTEVVADQVFIDGSAKKAAAGRSTDSDNIFGDEQNDFTPLDDEDDDLPFA